MTQVAVPQYSTQGVTIRLAHFSFEWWKTSYLKSFYGIGGPIIHTRRMPEVNPSATQRLKTQMMTNFSTNDLISEWTVTKIVGYGFCSYLLVGCGSVCLEISKSQLRLPQIVSYLVGYHFFSSKNVPFLPISQLRFAEVAYSTWNSRLRLHQK